MRELAPATVPSHLKAVLRANSAQEALDHNAELRSVAGSSLGLVAVGGDRRARPPQGDSMEAQGEAWEEYAGVKLVPS